MACYRPNRVALNDDDQIDWSVFTPVQGIHQVVMVPCRQCIGCTSGAAREWAIRCYHEMEFHRKDWRDPITKVAAPVPNSVMVTLTYDEEHLPGDRLLRHSDFQKFMKKLRRRSGEKLSYFMCGEYGGQTGRPHYHALLFGEDFRDRYQIRTSDQQDLSCSYELDEIWPHGRATVDDMNYGTVRYVTGYLSKKVNANGNFTGPLAELRNEHTGELTIKPLQPEYRAMSRNPGLGRHWIERNFERVYPLDEVQINGQSYPPPGFYDRWLRRHHPSLYVDVQRKRLDARIDSQLEWTPERCGSAEEIHSQRLRTDNQ